MNDKEKALISIVLFMFSAVLSYRVANVDNKLDELDKKIDKIILNKQEP